MPWERNRRCGPTNPSICLRQSQAPPRRISRHGFTACASSWPTKVARWLKLRRRMSFQNSEVIIQSDRGSKSRLYGWPTEGFTVGMYVPCGAEHFPSLSVWGLVLFYYGDASKTSGSLHSAWMMPNILPDSRVPMDICRCRLGSGIRVKSDCRRSPANKAFRRS